MTDGAGIENVLATMGKEIIKLTEQVGEMRGDIKGLVNHQLAAEQRVEIRAETEGMIDKATLALAKAEAAERKAERAEILSEAKTYTDGEVADLRLQLAAQEDRDKKRETDIRTQFIGLGVVGIAGIAYALWNLASGGN